MMEGNVNVWKSGDHITAGDVAMTIDHSLLRPDITTAELVEGCALAKEYHCVSVCVRPSDLPIVARELKDSGVLVTTVTFRPGTDPDQAQVQVQNKLQLAMPLLPQEVQQQGVSVEKSSSSFLMVVGVINTDGTMTQEDISDYVAANMKDAISRTSGVGDVQLFGSQYAMRIWMNPNELNKFQLTPVDVITAIKAQNAQVAAGQLGGTPPVKGQQLNASIIAQTRLTSTEEFGKILLKVNQDGSRVLLRDVAKIELGGENYDIIAEFNGQPASGLGIKLATGANALDTAAAIRAELAKMEPFFPSGLKIVYPYDTTPFVKISIHEVVKTLVEAIILVFLVM